MTEQTTKDVFENQRVLLVEDDQAHARLIRASLQKLGLHLEHAGTQEAALRLLKDEEYDVVLLDMKLPDGDGFEVQQWLNENAMSSSIVFVTADDLAEHAVQAVRAGAANYVVKRPDYLDELVAAAVDALDARLERTSATLGDPTRIIAQSIVGWSSSTVEARKLIAEYAQQLRPLLVVGEAGSGRSVVSRMVHAASRRMGPFVVADCRELSERLEQSDAPPGTFFERLSESAMGGTFVLEQIAAASRPLQEDLLGVIEHLPHRNIRLIAEAEFDPYVDVVGVEFSDGLWIRLSGTRIELQPLRERQEDIRPIASRELLRLGLETGRGRFGLDADAWTLLEAHAWNGNVHELLDCLRTIVAASPSKLAFDRYDTMTAIREIEGRFSFRSQHEQKERARLKAALDHHAWNVTATARALDVSRGWLRRRIESFGL